MRKYIILTISALALLSFINCGYQEGIRQTDKQSYLWFNGQTKSAVAIVDNLSQFKLEESYYIDSETGQKVSRDGKIFYQVKPGRHEIIVKKNGQVVVHRVVMIGSGEIKEIMVP